MESRTQQAIERHHKGYNCAQAIACTYADLFGMDEQTAYRMSESFGFGMGVQSVCGALTGALMLLGMKNSGGVQQPGTTKADTYAKARALEAAFRGRVGATLCNEIKAPPVTCSCDACIAHAAEIVEKLFTESV